MNRRELFTRLAGAFAAAQLPAIATDQVLEAPCQPAGALVVLRTDRLLPNSDRARILSTWKAAVKDTPWADARCIVLGPDMSLEVHDYATFGGKR